jgi:hypothetical protein
LESPLASVALKSLELSHHPFPHALVAEVENLLELEPPARGTAIRQAYRLPLSPYLEERMGALRCDPNYALEKGASIREIALLVSLVEPQLQPALAHAMSSSSTLRRLG